jgi:hypothetical protein
MQNIECALEVIKLGEGGVFQVDHTVGSGGLLPEMHYGFRPEVLKALVDEVRVAQVPLVKVDLLTKYLLKSPQALLP